MNKKVLDAFYCRRINEAIADRDNLEFLIVLTGWIMHRPTKDRVRVLEESYINMSRFNKAISDHQSLSVYEVESLLKVLGYQLEVKVNEY